jgi:hypothetical protein
MKLVWHIVKKDFRHLWLWLVLWWAVLASVVADPAWIFHRYMKNVPLDLLGVCYVFGGLLALVLVFLFIVARLVDADHPLDDRAQWRTQPVLPSRILAAKIIFLLLFGFLASLLIKTLVGRVISWDWPASQNFALILLCSLAVVFLAAVLFSRPFTGYALLICLYLCAAFCMGAIPGLERDTEPSALGLWLPLLLFFTVLLAALRCLYLQHHRRTALQILVPGLLLVYVIGRFWPAEPPNPIASSSTMLPAFPLEVQFPRMVTESFRHLSNNYYLEGSLSADSLPVQQPTEVWFPSRTRGTLSWPDHTSASDTTLLGDFFSPDLHRGSYAFPLRFAEALKPFGVKHLLNTLSYGSPWLAFFTDPVFQYLQQSPATFVGNISFIVGRLEEDGRVALTPGAVSGHGLTALGVVSVNPYSPVITVTLAEQSPKPATGPASAAGVDFYLLVNFKRGEAIVSNENGGRVTDLNYVILKRTEFHFYVADFTLSGWVYRIPPGEVDAWLADAQFVRLRFVPLGTQVGTFTLPSLSAPPSAKP